MPAVYQSNFYGSGESGVTPLREYVGKLQDYLAKAPAGSNFAEQSPRVHGLFSDPGTGTGDYDAFCNSGYCPTDLLTNRLFEGDHGYVSHPDEESAALFNYNQSYISTDQRVAYYSEEYPWLRSVHKFTQPANLHSDYDLIEIAINNTQPGDGQHFIVHWFADAGESLFYTDVMDVNVHDSPIESSLRYGLSTGKRSFSRIDHCQHGAGTTGYRRVVTPIR